jgi:DNA polymerase-3 subunit beta
MRRRENAGTHFGSDGVISISIPRDQLAADLGFCASAVQKRAVTEMLKYVLLEVKSGMLHIRATDLELTAFASVQASEGTASEDGSLTVELAPLLAYARSAPDETVTISAAAGYVTLTSGGAKLKLPTLPVENFPHDPRETVTGDPIVDVATLPMADLAHLIKSVSYAIGEEKIRFDVSGALFVSEKRKFDAVTTDGHRIAYASVPLPESHEQRVQLNRRAMDAIVKLADEGTAEVTATRNWTAVAVDGRLLMSRAADVNFPAWREAIPKSFPVSVEVRTDAVLGSVRRALVAAGDGSREIKLSLSKASMAMSAADAARSADDRLVIDYAGEDFSVAINGRYLSETLAVIADEMVEIAFTQPSGGELRLGMIRLQPVSSVPTEAEQVHYIVPIVR